MIQSNPCSFRQLWSGEWLMTVTREGQSFTVRLDDFRDDPDFLTGIRHVQMGIKHPEVERLLESAAYTWGRQIARIYDCTDESLVEDIKNAFEKGELRIG